MSEKICSLSNCENKYYAKSYCKRHYYKKLRTGHTDYLVYKERTKPTVVVNIKRSKRTCSVQDCNNPHFAKTYCRKHYHRHETHGNILQYGFHPLTEERLRHIKYIEDRRTVYKKVQEYLKEKDNFESIKDHNYMIENEIILCRLGYYDGKIYKFEEIASRLFDKNICFRSSKRFSLNKKPLTPGRVSAIYYNALIKINDKHLKNYPG